MKLSEQEKAANREAFKRMNLAQKADYVYAYYKLPLVIALIVVVFVGSVTYRALTHKDPILYVAFANVVVPADVQDSLSTKFVELTGEDPRKCAVECYRELYLSADANLADHQYAYASRLKVMAAVEGHELDAVFMNQEAYDLLSASGYLLDLSDAFADNPLLCTNVVVLETNQVEFDLGEADKIEATTMEETNALDVTASPLLKGFSGDEAIYLGIIANTERPDLATDYLRYVAS